MTTCVVVVVVVEVVNIENKLVMLICDGKSIYIPGDLSWKLIISEKQWW